MKLKSLCIVLIAIFISQNVWSSGQFRIFTALSVGAKKSSNFDIKEYIEATRLGPDAKKRLFQLADQDWDKYQEILRGQHQVHYNDALKELAYAQLLEHSATKNQEKNKRRQSFLTTEEEYFNKVQKNETQAVEKYLELNLGIEEARKRFGQDLIEQGFPHQRNESPETVYWRWYEDQKQIVREAIRKQEIQRHEHLEATRYNKKLHVRPADLFDLKDRLDVIIDEQLHGQKMTLAQAQGVLSSHPALKHRISKLHLVSMDEEPMAKIKELDQDEFNQYLSIIRDSIPKILNEEFFLKRLEKYEAASATLAQKYEDSQKLQQLSETSLNDFVEGGNYNDFMMARLYALASSLVQDDVNRVKVKKKLFESLKTALPQLIKRLSNPETYLKKENRSFLFESVAAKELREILRTSKLQGHLKKIMNMAIWVVKFEAKKIALQKRPKIFIEKVAFDSFEGQNKLNEYLKGQEYKRGLKDYHRNRLSRIDHLLHLKTLKGEELSDHEAYRFVLGND